MRRYLWLIALCLFTLSSVGQTFKGRVADLNGNPISYAALYTKELKYLPFLRKKNFDEALHLRSLVVYGCQPYCEYSFVDVQVK